MASGLVLRLLAFAAFMALIGGGVYGAYETLQTDALAPRGVSVRAADPALAVTPGHAVAIGFAVTNFGEVAEAVRVSVTDARDLTPSEPVTVNAAANNGTGAFLLVDVPADAATGEVPVTITAETVKAPVKRAQTTVTLTILADDGTGLAEGQGAVVQYVGRLASTGELFDTNIGTIAELPFPRTSFFRSSTVNATVYTDAQANLIAGFKNALIGMHENETRTIRLASEDAYGPDEVTFTEPRQETLPRETTLPVRPVPSSIEDFNTVIADQKKTADDFEVNDTFTTELRGDTYRFRITDKTADTITYALEPEIGDRFTIPDHAYWPKAAEAVSVNDTAVVLRITPATDVGEPFTMRDYWPNATKVLEVTDDSIVVEHAPAEGSTFERPVRQGGEPALHRVVAVEDDVLRLAYESPHPLAGEDIVFDLRVVKILPPRGAN